MTETQPQSRGILTIAFGRPKYIEMAKSLARSLMWHTPSVPRAVVTDSSDPELHDLFTYRIDYRPEYGTNVRQKMYIDRYSPFEKTLFVDSDSLATRGLNSFWSAFQSVPFGVCGARLLRAGEVDEHLDVDFVMERFGLAGLPKFNGGTYYFNRSREATALFTTARDLLNRSADLKFGDFRGDGPNDESLYSVAMAIHGLTGTDMGDGGMRTLINSTSPLIVDIPRGICTFVKRGRVLTPDIIHFANFTESHLYLKESLKLKQLTQLPRSSTDFGNFGQSAPPCHG